MSREIKFRAWDGSNLLPPVSMRQIFDGDKSLAVNMLKERWELMQYTGLKDKHGVEIYEGDVLMAPELPFVSPVEFRDGFYALASRPSFVIDGPKFEVIGNIYENPELLG